MATAWQSQYDKHEKKYFNKLCMTVFHQLINDHYMALLQHNLQMVDRIHVNISGVYCL